MNQGFLSLLMGSFACLTCSVNAQVSTNDLKLAQDFFESGNYAHAKTEYEGLLEGGLDPWKKQILNYDIGTAFLAEGKWEEAMLRFQPLVDEDIQLPLLKQKVRSNLALARVMQLDENLERLKNNQKATSDDYQTTFMLLRQALLDIDRAQLAWCVLEKVEGAKGCRQLFDLQAMRLDVKSHFNEFLEDYSAFRLVHSSLQEGISSLLFGENSLINQLNIFQQYQLSEQMKETYLQMYLEQASSWKPLWESLQATFKSGSKAIDTGKQRGVFDSAYQQYLESISLAEQGNFQASMAKLENSRASLNNLLHQFFNDSSSKDLLQQLLITYGLALVKEPLQEAYLEQILEVQTALGETLKKSETAVASDYEKAQKYLKASVQSLANFQDIKARIFAEVARFYIKNIFQQMDFTPKTQASSVLENAIDKQEFILLLNSLRQQVEGDTKDLADVDKLLPELQQATLKAADIFPEAAVTQQKVAFSSDANKKSRCQCHPWDEVIPLFSTGYLIAEQANEYLKINVVKQSTIERLQKKAIDHWKEALAKMHATSSKSKQTSEQQSQQQSQPPPEEGNGQPENQPQNGQLNDILRLVQDMEKDDRSKPMSKTATGNNKGDDRPW